MNTIKKSICIILALISVFAFNACGKKEKTYPPAKEISLATIQTDYEKNKINARETHEGERYRITAYVDDISEEEVVATELVGINYVEAHLKYKEQEDFVRSITTDDTITFEGTLTNMSFADLTFEDVIFVVS